MSKFWGNKTFSVKNLPLNMTSTYFFTKTQIIFAFRRYVKSCVQRLGQRVKYASGHTGCLCTSR